MEYKFSWVSFPSDQYRYILSILNQPPFIIKSQTMINLDNGSIYNKIVVTTKDTLKIREIVTLIGNTQLYPVSLSLESEDPNYINNCISLVTGLVSSYFSTSVKSVEITRYPDMLILTPYTHNGSFIYRLPNDIYNFLHIVNLNISNESNGASSTQPHGLCLKEYRFLSDDPLIYYVLMTNPNIVNFDHIRTINNSMIIKDNDMTIAEDINTNITNLRRSGFYSIPSKLSEISNYNGYNIKLYDEIAQMIGIDSYPFPKFYIFHSDLDFIIDPVQWFQDNVSRINNNGLPHFLVEIVYNGSFTPDIKMKFYLLALISFHQLCKYNPILTSFIPQVEVHDNMTIDIPITSLQDVTTFKQILSDNQYLIVQWKLFPCHDIYQALFTKWIIQSSNRSLNLNIVIFSYNQVEYVIVDSFQSLNITEQYISDILKISSNYPITDIIDPQIVKYYYALLKQLKETYNLTIPESSNFQDYIHAILNEYPPQYHQWLIRGLVQLSPFSGIISMTDLTKEIPIKKIIGDIVVVSSNCSIYPPNVLKEKSQLLLEYNVCSPSSKPKKKDIYVTYDGCVIPLSTTQQDVEKIYNEYADKWSSGKLLNPWSRLVMDKMAIVSQSITRR